MKRIHAILSAVGAMALALLLVGWLSPKTLSDIVTALPGGTTYLSGQLVIQDASGSPPTCATSTAAGELCVEGDIETNGNIDNAGTLTQTGAATFAGAVTFNGLATATVGEIAGTTAVTDTVSLTSANCGEIMFVTAGIDTKTITLPSTVAGCVYTFMYTGADGGALLDISPAAADAIHGSCTLAASVLEFNGTDDNDIGLTKATANTGDTITLVGDGTQGWYVTACAGIWANN